MSSSKMTYSSLPHLPGLLPLVSLTPQQATVNPRCCQRLPNTHRQFWLSLLWGHCSFLLGPGVHKVLFVPSKNLFPQPYGSSIIKLRSPSKSDSLRIQSLCWIPRLESVVGLERSQNFFGIIFLQFMAHPYGVREYSNFVVLQIAVQFSQHHLLKSFFPLYSLASFVRDSLIIDAWVYL